MSHKYWFIPIVWSSLLVRCTLGPLAGGSDNPDFKVYGTVVHANGDPASNTQVRLIPAAYNPVTDTVLPAALTDTTDSNGVYSFRLSKKGTYAIQAVNIAQRTRAAVTGISVQQDSNRVSGATLSAPGAIRAMLPAGIDALNGYLYIPGTAIFTFLNGNDSSTILDSLPAGTSTVLSYAMTNSGVQRVLRYGIPVTSGNTVTITNLDWQYARNLCCNTTPSGANVTGDAYGFPVLIRLTGVNFYFAQAGAGGADIRFTKSDNTPLPYEIERWDAAQARAEIWVKIDTIAGNNATQYITMYWGNSGVADSSDGGSVFDTGAAGGFQGVWHLAEAANTRPGGYYDATASGYNLTGTGNTYGGSGVIGPARGFDSTTDYLTGWSAPAKLNGNVSFTVSFWIKTGIIKPGALQVNRVDIMDFGRKGTPKSAFHMFLWPNYTTQFGFDDPVVVDSSPDSTTRVAQNVFNFSAYAGTWTYVATVFDAGAGTISTYVNGALADRDSVSGVNMITAGGLRVGRPYYAGEAEFDGAVDELRIMAKALSDTYIRLNYENQKPGSGMVFFRNNF
jgi:hypothetical protein